jgi:REP element-mobilizing transposase RayT
MPRTARRDAPGVVSHVLLRGIERTDIFRDARDRRSFLARLDEIVPACDLTCYAFALMPNHAHLVLRTGNVPLARAMARLLTGHAVYFNRRHDRVGHLLQNRYKTHAVTDDVHLRILVRYVHRNPLRAGLVADLSGLARSPWTGHGALMGAREARFVAVRETLSLFGDHLGEAREQLAGWMRGDGDGTADAPPAEASLPPRIPQLDALVLGVAREFGVSPRELAAGGRRREVTRARERIARLACRERGLAAIEVARALGISESAVLRAARRDGAAARRGRRGTCAG